MNGARQFTVESLTRYLQEQAPEFAEKIVAAINAAPEGDWIAASEEGVRVAGNDFVRAAFQAALQRKVDAAEAAFPPSAGFNGQEKEK